jgi:ABC-type nitrate/sulfonate/bicarbonate transport system substrate-binding protein
MKQKGILIGLLRFLFFIFLFNLSWGLTAVKVGLLKLFNPAPIFIGMDKGFLKSEGIKVESVWFKAAQPIVVALAPAEILTLGPLA